MTREEKIAEFKKQLNEKLEKKREKWANRKTKDFTPPRYDDVYFEGIEWLDKNG